MGVVLLFQKPRPRTWHDALTREQLAQVVRRKIEQEDPWLDFFTPEEERQLEKEIGDDLITLKCVRLIARGVVYFA